MKNLILFLSLFFTLGGLLSQNQVLSLDGQNDYVNLGGQAGNNVRTIEMWFNPTVSINTSINRFHTLVARNTGGAGVGDHFEFALTFTYIGSNDGKLRFSMNDDRSTNYNVYSNANSWAANTWYHVAAVVDPVQGMKLFIDGIQQIDTDPYRGDTDTSRFYTAIGRWGDFTGNRYFNGLIENLKFSSTATYTSNFTPACNQLNTNADRGFWDFNSSASGIIIDSSNYGNNGVLIAGAQKVTIVTVDNQVACEIYTWPLNNITYTTSTNTPTVTLTNLAGCDSVIELNLTINPAPVVDFTFSPNCLNGGAQFTDASSTSSGSMVTWSWNFGDGLGTSNLQNPTYQYQTAGQFNVTLIVQSTFGCSDSIIKLVVINPLATVDAGIDVSTCEGNAIQIGGPPISTAIGATYIWSPIAGLNDPTVSNPTAIPSVTTTYSVTVTTGTGCTSVDQMVLTINRKPTTDAGADQTICVGQSTVIGGAPTGPLGSTYQWSSSSSSSNIFIANPTVTPTATTTYYVTVIGANGCNDTDNMIVTVGSANSTSIQNAIICAGSSFTYPDGFVQHNITSSITRTSVLQNSVGCDSTITTNLSITNVMVGVSQSGATLTANQSGAQYQWFNCSTNSAISGAINQSYTATGNGSFAVRVTSNNCVDSSICLQVISVGLDEQERVDAMKIYPNPSEGEFTLQFDNGIIRDIIIYDVNGRVVKEMLNSSKEQVIFDLNLSQGMYFVKIKTDSKVNVLPIVIQ